MCHMAKRKTVESAETAPVVAEAKPVARKTSRAKGTASTAAHKHHTAIAVSDPVSEAPVIRAEESISHESIARLAYALWEARGYQPGSPEQDWFEAERQLLKLS
jgi:hypothetical protein